MFWAFKLSIVVDILTFLAWRMFGLLFQKLGNFFKSSGRPDDKINIFTKMKLN
jgi:hypothetical protein